MAAELESGKQYRAGTNWPESAIKGWLRLMQPVWDWGYIGADHNTAVPPASNVGL